MFYGPDDLFQNGRDGPQPHYLLIICRIVEIELSWYSNKWGFFEGGGLKERKQQFRLFISDFSFRFHLLWFYTVTSH